MKLQLLAVAATFGASFVDAANQEAHERLMQLKTQQWDVARAQGLFEGSKLYKKITSFQPCRNGKAGEYSCKNVDMHGFLSHEDLGSGSKAGNDVWGWTSRSGREFGIVGQTDGVAFVEINRITGSLDYLGRLPSQIPTPTSWRDMKVIDNHVYIGSENAGHGLQIFDLRKLEDVKPWWNPFFFRPKVFSIETDIVHFAGFGSSHNIVADTDRKIIYAVGGQQGANSRNSPCRAGMFIVDVSDPNNPTSPGCTPQDGYVHDAQCVVYTGVDSKYSGKNICFNFNEDTFTVMDMTDLTNPIVVSRTPYVGNAYSHQGWLLDGSMKYILLDDELDELDRVGPAAEGKAITYIFDISSLERPVNTGFYSAEVRSIDHNLYTRDGITYHANYGSGLRIRDTRSIPNDPTGKSTRELAFFDVHPQDDAQGGVVEFLGTWSVYPYFRSKFILVNSIERGIFSVKWNGR